MILYHGTQQKFDRFKTPTGLEVMDVTRGGVVYLTEDYDVAKRYAKQGGYVATVEADATSYAAQLAKQGRKKQKKYVRGVWVALPSQCTITKWDRI